MGRRASIEGRESAATLVLAAIVAAVGGAAWWLRHDAAAAVADLPHAARSLRLALQADRRPSPMAHVREAAAELERAAAEATGKPPEPQPATAPAPAQSELSKQLTEHGAAVIKVGGQLAIAATLALFMLATGDLFRRKLVRLVGPSLSRRRVTVGILDEIDVQVQRYLGVTLFTNATIALRCWGAFSIAGLDRAALWAALTGVLHFIPYVGSVLALVLVAAAALAESGSLATAAWVVSATFAVILAIGMGLNTWLQGRACRMNPVAIFVALLLFGWLWGAWGVLLGAPLVAVVTTVADRVETLNPLGELLGEVAPRVAAATERSPSRS